MSISKRRKVFLNTNNIEPPDILINDVLTLDGIKNTRMGHSTTTTTWQDLSGNKNDFTQVSEAQAATWNNTNCTFNATNKVFNCNKQILKNLSNFTIELVIFSTYSSASYDDSSGKMGYIFCNNASNTTGLQLYNYRSNASNYMYLSNKFQNQSMGALNISRNITYCTYVFDGTNVIKYINGTISGNPVEKSFSSLYNETNWYIGGTYDTNNSEYKIFYYGNIYRIGISSYAMTAEEIAERFIFFQNRFNIPNEKIYLYNNGVTSEIYGPINNKGYSANATYNKATFESTYLQVYGNSSGATAAVKGGKTFSFENPLPAEYIGKKVYIRGKHKNTSSNASDIAYIFISDALPDTTSTSFATAFPNYIYNSFTMKQASDFTNFELSLTITRAGYLSIVGRKNGGGYSYIQFYEIFIL